MMYIFLRRLKKRIYNISGWLLFSSLLFLLFGGAFFIRTIEPKTFTTYLDAVWYVVITSSTIGYGDFYANSAEGKLFVMLFIIPSGLVLFAAAIAKVTEIWGTYKKMKEEGKLEYKGENHILVINWSRLAETAILEGLEKDKETEYVIIDNLLEKEPMIHERVHFVKGVGSHEAVLKMANVDKAKSAIVFGRKELDAEVADSMSHMAIAKIEKMNSSVRSVVVLMDKSNRQSFEDLNVDDFIEYHQTISHLAIMAAHTTGVTKAFSDLLTEGKGSQVYSIKKKENWLTYKDAYLALLEEGATLFSNKEDTTINKKLNETIPDDAELYVICDRQVLKKLKTP